VASSSSPLATDDPQDRILKDYRDHALFGYVFNLATDDPQDRILKGHEQKSARGWVLTCNRRSAG